MNLGYPRVLLAIMLVALWFFVAGCSENDSSNPVVDPDPFDASHLMGFWQCDEADYETYPITALSFGDLSSGMLGTSETLEYYGWSATDSTLLLTLIDGIRTYNYDVVDDTLSVWVGQGGRLYFAHMLDADTVYYEQNPYRITLALPEAEQVYLKLFDTAGTEVASLFEEDLESGYHQIYFEYPDAAADQLLAFDAIRGTSYHKRQYRYVTNRPPLPQAAIDIADEWYDADVYLNREFAFAQSSEYGDEFIGERNDWDVLSIQEKIEFLPNNFRRNLPIEGNTSYYWLIGDYPYQFGYGWSDEVDDDMATVEWDGTSAKMTEFRQLLGLE